LCDRVRHDTINADDREHDSDRREERQERRVQPRLTDRLVDNVLHAANIEQRKRRIDLVHDLPRRRDNSAHVAATANENRHRAGDSRRAFVTHVDHRRRIGREAAVVRVGCDPHDLEAERVIP
jgi:hypothetical protein